MLSVVDRLVESWLDSQGERQYQPAFIQLLVSEGWSVLHNTRHSPIELGKDVIARNHEGELYCFQLKGNPGTRVTKAEAQGLLSQVIELIELPPSALYRGPGERHVAVLVTNGTVDEEAELLFSRAAERTAVPTCAASRFEILTRGDLLARFVKVAGQIWPTSVNGTRAILNIMAEDGRSLPDPVKIGEVLTAAAPAPEARASQAFRNARLNALLVIAEVVKAPWQAAANHYGLFSITVLASMHALLFCDAPARIDVAARYADLALEHARDLIAEAHASAFAADEVWAEQIPLDEIDFMAERGRLVADCAAILSLSGETAVPDDLRQYAKGLVATTVKTPLMWGFAVVPSSLLRWWAFEQSEDREVSAEYLEVVLGAMLERALRIGGSNPMPGPYYSFLDVWAWNGGVANVADSAIFEDNFERRVWFARSLLQILARRGAKDRCKRLWPLYAQVVHEEAALPAERFFDPQLVRDEGGVHTSLFDSKTWIELTQEAEQAAGAAFLAPFQHMAWLFAAYVAIVPYRGWTDVLMWVDHAFLNDPIPAPNLGAQAGEGA
jgi:hypothetical protein